MSFFKNLVSSIKNAFGGDDNERQEVGLAKQKETLSSYQQATAPQPKQQPLAQQVQNLQKPSSTTVNPTTHKPAPAAQVFTEVSDIIEHDIVTMPGTSLDILVDSLGLNKKKIVCDRGIVSIPFDASGCDFDTKRQVAQAIATEYGLVTNVAASNIACSETAKRAFSSIKGAREECFVCGTLLVAINQDIDDEGYMLAEVTNTHNGNTVFFDIPASIAPDGAVDVNYDLIAHNLLIARDKTL